MKRRKLDEYKSDEKLDEDQYILDERKYYIDLLQTKRETTRKEVKDRILQTNTEFNKDLTEDKQVQHANWEDIIETMGYTIVRNKLFQEIKDYTMYHGSRTIPPMQPCLVKVFIEKEHKRVYNIKSLERVVKVVLNLKSDRIIKLLGAIEVKQTEKMYFFEELCKMPLSNYFKASRQPLDSIKAKVWFLQVASGVLYLHNHGFAHQKITLDTCFVQSDGEGIKLGCPDALAEQVTYDQIKAFSKYSELLRPVKKGLYNSFDTLFGDPRTYDAFAADIWSLGVMLFYFLTLKHPFNGWKSKKEMSTEVQCKRWSFVGMMDNYPRLDEDQKVFLSKIFVSSPEARLTIHELLIDTYLFKKFDDPQPPPPPPPIPIPVPPPPAIKTALEEEFDWAHNERQNQIVTLKVFHDEYNEKYRYKRFQQFQGQVVRHQLTPKEFDKVNFEEGMQSIRILRTNLVHESNETQLYEGFYGEQSCFVKTDVLATFLKKYHIKDLASHLKLVYELKAPDKFVQLHKCYVVQTKIYLCINVDKNLRRLSEKFHEELPIDNSLARSWTRQMVEAIHFLHSKGLALPSMDPEFIYVKNNNQLIIGQIESVYSVFSFDESLGSKVTNPTRNIVKTPFFAPEAIFTETTFDPFAADVWIIAAIIYNLLFLRCPFDTKIKKTYFEQVEQKRWLHVFDKKYKLDNDFFSFFDSIFIESAEARPTSIELMFASVVKNS